MTSYISSKLTPAANDWLVSAVDPFHDFEHPIEGAPDEAITKSYTRKFVQTATVSAVADDDRVSIYFLGHHGGQVGMFEAWGAGPLPEPAGEPGFLAKGLWPIMAMRTAVAHVPTIQGVFDGTTTILQTFITRQVDYVPSRLVSLGVEVTDVTPQLYRKGTIVVAHSNGETEIGAYNGESGEEGVLGNVAFYRKPPVAIDNTQAMAMPGSYLGPVSKGVYVQARLNKIQPPVRGEFQGPTGTFSGPCTNHPLLAECYTPPFIRQYQPVAKFGVGSTPSTIPTRPTWCDSGFTPFSILATSLAAETVLQVVVKATVEYFPQTAFPFECGLATYSPPYEPEAFRIYHEVMRQIPAAVPVGMNASGDYWKMIVAAARKAAVLVMRYGPVAGRALAMAGGVMGAPEAVFAGNALRVATSALSKRSGSMKKKNKK